jgi:hypothetical protein
VLQTIAAIEYRSCIFVAVGFANFALVTPIMLLMATIIVIAGPKKPRSGWFTIPVIYAMLWLIWTMFLAQIWFNVRLGLYRSRLEKEVAAMAKLRRCGLCTECGYDLTGNKSGVCPECGRKIFNGVR